jgi:uncharacterized glyoxalase superfamily protein PhnB
MSNSTDAPIVTPYLCYGDPGKAIDWLVEAFGFTKLAAYDDGAGNIVHAELRVGDRGMLMISPANPTLGMGDPQRLTATSVGIFVRLAGKEEVDRVHAGAVAAGATVLLDLEEKSHGSYEFTCHDLAGHVWTFGMYNPGLG